MSGTAVTWGDLWWRVKMLARVWYAGVRRRVIVYVRARRLSPAWRRPARLRVTDWYASPQWSDHVIVATPLDMAASLREVYAQTNASLQAAYVAAYGRVTSTAPITVPAVSLLELPPARVQQPAEEDASRERRTRGNDAQP